ncbi:MAG: PatB family C-S lyase [Synergistaceae bacterium]|nr:PatB family C-S lyase [Synergistaceae bacterium]
MVYDFDTPVNRKGTGCEKWDEMASAFGKGDLLPFWVADMDFKAAPEIVETLREKTASGVFGYPVMTDSARESVAGWLGTRHGFSVDVPEVGFSPGIITSLSIAVQEFTSPGDGVVIQTPVYPQFFTLIRKNGRAVVENPLIETENGYEMDFDNLRRVITPNVRAMLLCSPHNPVGRVWKPKELKQLAEICMERGVTLLSDEIHQDIVYSGARHEPFQLAAPEASACALTFVAPSKTFNIAGLCGSAWVAKDRKIAQRMEKALSSVHCANINMLALAALEAAYRKGAPWLDQLVAYLEGNRDFLEKFLRERLPKAKMKRPEGTFVFWLDFRGYGLDAKELQRVLVEEAGVALNPGGAFSGDCGGFARMNVGCPRAMLEEGLSRMERAFAKL